MLNNAKTLKGYKLLSLDGEIGRAEEFYFDDRYWTIRYLVADTGTWLHGRQVLIAPHALVSVNDEMQSIGINLSKKQIQESPSLHSDKPVSRQFEEEYHAYYGWPFYWSQEYALGMAPNLTQSDAQPIKPTHSGKPWNPHLRSTRDATGHHIHATDGEIGHVEDFIIDDQTWAIRYLLVNTRNWWPGKRVLVSPHWIERVSWEVSAVFVNLSREAVKQSPEFTAESLLTRDYEIALHRHYQRQGYWGDEAALERIGK